MQDYSNFDVKDFLADEDFCRWVIRQQSVDNIFWENWLKKNPDRAQIVSTSKSLIVEMQQAQHYLSDEELQHELLRLSDARKSVIDDIPAIFEKRNWFGKLATVVVVLVSAMTFYHFYTDYKSATKDQASYEIKNKALTEIVNDGKVIKTVLLKDGSRVKLSPNSKISYSEDFIKTKREVFLNGEAFFEVTKNPQSPFTVYTSDIVTTVLGTSFLVKAFEKDKNVSVVVKTGKVTVATAARGNHKAETAEDEMVLLPNQQVVYRRDEQKMKRSLVENPLPVGPVEVTSQNLVFESTPVAKVFEMLQKRYEVQIVYDADLLAGCQLTAELGQEPLFEKMAMICKAIQARYELIDGQIIIHGASCK